MKNAGHYIGALNAIANKTDDDSLAALLIDAANKIAEEAATIARLRELLKTTLGLETYVNNPSAWDNYDEVMSDRIRLVTNAIRRELRSGSESEE